VVIKSENTRVGADFANSEGMPSLASSDLSPHDFFSKPILDRGRMHSQKHVAHLKCRNLLPYIYLALISRIFSRKHLLWIKLLTLAFFHFLIMISFSAASSNSSWASTM
jgi:hypothetical protein